MVLQSLREILEHFFIVSLTTNFSHLLKHKVQLTCPNGKVFFVFGTLITKVSGSIKMSMYWIHFLSKDYFGSQALKVNVC